MQISQSSAQGSPGNALAGRVNELWRHRRSGHWVEALRSSSAAGRRTAIVPQLPHALLRARHFVVDVCRQLPALIRLAESATISVFVVAECSSGWGQSSVPIILIGYFIGGRFDDETYLLRGRSGQADEAASPQPQGLLHWCHKIRAMSRLL